VSLLTIANLVFAYGGHRVLDGVNLTLGAGEHVGLVGRNGCGKSTLMKLLAGSGALVPTEGQVQLARGAAVGYLSQDFEFDATLTLRQEAGRTFAELAKLHQQLDDLTQTIAQVQGPGVDRLLKDYEKVEQRMQVAGGYAVDHQIDATLAGLGFHGQVFDVKMGDLSGGQKARLALAKLLLSQPAVLLLDEPTNHLDIAGRQWLEQYLIGYRGAVILISHDRWLLNRAVTRIYELENGALVEYPGNYEKYRELRIERRLAQHRAFEKHQTKVRQEQAFIDRYRAGQRSKQAQGREKRLERFKETQAVERPIELDAMNVRLSVTKRAGDVVIDADGIRKGYEGKPLFGPLSVTIERGGRIGVIGPNGAGKSTLARCLLTETACDDGRVRLGAQVSVGHYRQTHDQIDQSQTVVEYLQRQLGDGAEQSARDLAGAFLFSGIEQDKPLKLMSGGECSRAVLAGLVAGGHNMLVLDEPTNHLDIPSAERLEESLRQYAAPPRGWGENTTGGGTLILITHDRMLLENLVDQLLIFDGEGNVRHFYGTYSDLLESERELQRQDRAAGADEKTKPTRRQQKQQPQTAVPKKKRRSALSTEQLERKIMKLEQDMVDIDGQLADPDVYRDPQRVRDLVSRRDELKQTLTPLEEEWLNRADGD
jgi:ATP-binding cassette subfamily F protein 3